MLADLCSDEFLDVEALEPKKKREALEQKN